MRSHEDYVGRFAPSPTAALHAGSLVAALASWLDARAARGRWLVRIEDLDSARCAPGADQVILRQLHDCSLLPDAPPLWQSQRQDLYRKALDQLVRTGHAYPCACSRKDIEAELERLGRPHARHTELVYPGGCRNGLRGKPASAWRFRTQTLSNAAFAAPPDAAAHGVDGAPQEALRWCDRRLGAQQQNVGLVVGDFVLQRADGPFSYQLAVVADDAAQGINHVVRGADLADNTARQIMLQLALAVPRPRYLHTPLVLGPDGEKLSKQNGAQAVDTGAPLAALNVAAATLELTAQGGGVGDALAAWVEQWRDLYNPDL